MPSALRDGFVITRFVLRAKFSCDGGKTASLNAIAECIFSHRIVCAVFQQTTALLHDDVTLIESDLFE